MAGAHDAMEFRAANLRREILAELDWHHDVVGSVNHEGGQRNRRCALGRIETVEGLLLAGEALHGSRASAS